MKTRYYVLLFLWALILRADQASMNRAWDDFNREASERRVKGLPSLSLIDLYSRYTDEDKRVVLKNWAVHGALFSEIPDKWPLIDEASVALPWLRIEMEPLADPVLASLERCLTGDMTDAERLKINAIRYRYSKPGAREYLLKLLRDTDDIEAAKILALNREEAALESIARLVDQERGGAELIYALGRWSRSTDEILFRGLHQKRDYVSTTYLRALSMSEHKITAAEENVLLGYSKSKSSMVRVGAIGVLLRQGRSVPGGEEYLLDQMIHNSTGRYFTAWTLNQIDSSIAKKTFRNSLENYLARKDSNRFSTTEYEALVGLLKDPTQEDWDLALAVLHSLPVLDDITMGYPAIPVGALLYKRGTPEVRHSAVAHIGNRVNLAIVDAENLRRLPPDYLPNASRMVEWNHTDLGSGNSRGR